MSHIFIAYTRKDRERAAALADTFEAEGWPVWWNRTIPVGQEYTQVIDEALAAAKYVVVNWPGDSDQILWVREEAEEGPLQPTENANTMIHDPARRLAMP